MKVQASGGDAPPGILFFFWVTQAGRKLAKPWNLLLFKESLFIMKNLTVFRKMVETSMDLRLSTAMMW